MPVLMLIIAADNRKKLKFWSIRYFAKIVKSFGKGRRVICAKSSDSNVLAKNIAVF